MVSRSLLGLGFVVVLAFALVNGARLMRRLESAHTEVWNRLGRPDFLLSSGIGPRIALVRYVWSGDWRMLDDATLRRHCLAALIAEPLLVALSALLVLD